jgi:hypothetical protein
MVVFGPVLDDTGSWGLGVVEAEDEKELRAFAAGDPVVTTGTGDVEVGKIGRSRAHRFGIQAGPASGSTGGSITSERLLSTSRPAGAGAPEFLTGKITGLCRYQPIV